jgi:hypothetical protein
LAHCGVPECSFAALNWVFASKGQPEIKFGISA